MRLALVTGPVTEPVTLAEVKANSRIDGTDLDTHLSLLISVARRVAEQKTDRSYGSQTWCLFLTSWPVRVKLPRPPVVTIAQVEYDAPGGAMTLSSSFYTIEADDIRPVLRFIGDMPELAEYGQIKITYTAGGTAPPEIKFGIMAMVEAALDNPSAAQEGSVTSVEFVERMFDRDQVPGL